MYPSALVPLCIVTSTEHTNRVKRLVEHSDSRFELIRFDSLSESIRILSFPKNRNFRFDCSAQVIGVCLQNHRSTDFRGYSTVTIIYDTRARFIIINEAAMFATHDALDYRPNSLLHGDRPTRGQLVWQASPPSMESAHPYFIPLTSFTARCTFAKCGIAIAYDTIR